jgi:hypothetical protein
VFRKTIYLSDLAQPGRLTIACDGDAPGRESPKARAALGILEKHGWLVPLDAGTVVRGAARAEAWAIVKGAGDVV